MNLKQGDMSMTQYEAKFLAFVRFAPLYQTDERKKTMNFSEGLRPDIRNVVAPLGGTTFNKVAWRVKCTERNLNLQAREKEASRVAVMSSKHKRYDD